MTSPQDPPNPDRVQTPTVSTAPTSGESPPAGPRWWRWETLPDHLGRARTSTVILSLLFVAVFALYLNVRPDVARTGTSPAGGGSDVEAPRNPVVPAEPTAPERTEEPVPPTAPGESDGTDEETRTPTSGSTPSTSSPGPTSPTSGPGEPAETSEPSGPTGGTTEPSTSATSSAPAP